MSLLFLLIIDFYWHYNELELLWLIDKFYLLIDVDVERFLGFLVNTVDW